MGSGKVLKSKHANEMIIYIWDKLIKIMNILKMKNKMS